MTKQQKAKKILLLLTLFSLSLLVVAPLASNALAYPNKASLLPTSISTTQTPGSISTGKTWTYRFTYRNSTPFTGSFTYTQQNGGVVSIADFNYSVQQCYKFVTTIDVIQFWTALGYPSALGPDISSDTQILSVYLKTTDYSIPRMDILEVFGYTNGTSSQTFSSSLLDFTVNLYEFPLFNGQSWTSTASSWVSGWTVNASGYNQTYGPSVGLPFNVNALVSGPTSVTVPAGTYQAYQINYAAIPLLLLFGWPGLIPLSMGLASVQCWYSLDAQNFVKCFLDYGSGTNVTVDLLSISEPLQTMLFLIFYSAQQQQSFFKLLLIGGGIGAVIIIAGIAIAIHRRRG